MRVYFLLMWVPMLLGAYIVLIAHTELATFTLWAVSIAVLCFLIGLIGIAARG
jgi:uncharacterized membrane protein YoaK (UPF0700 family)